MSKVNMKTIGYVLAIGVLFIPVVQLALSTFIDSPDSPREYPCAKSRDLNQINETYEKESQAAWDAYQDERKDSNVKKFILASIIGLLAILIAIFIRLSDVVKYGLFAGAVMNEVISVMIFGIEKSIIGWISLAVLFLLVVWFANKDTK